MALPDTHIPIPAKDWWLNLLHGLAAGMVSGFVSVAFLNPVVLLFLAPTAFWAATFYLQLRYADPKWRTVLLLPIYIAIQWGVAWLLYFDSFMLATGIGGAAVLLSVALLLKTHRQWRTALWCLLALVLVLAALELYDRLATGRPDVVLFYANVIAWQMTVLAGIAVMLQAAHGRRMGEGPVEASIPPNEEAE